VNIPGDRAFLIYDELHAEYFGQFDTLGEAIADVERLAAAAWDQGPNRAPCISWRTCGRRYVVQEVDDPIEPWTVLGTIPVCDVSAAGVSWLKPMSSD
jgi:hypothetical protein